MANVQDIVNAVNAEKTVIEGVTTLLDQLFAQVQAAKADPAALDAALAGIQANKDALAAAVARDTDAHDEIHAAGM